jgi:hypothetical protein
MNSFKKIIFNGKIQYFINEKLQFFASLSGISKNASMRALKV